MKAQLAVVYCAILLLFSCSQSPPPRVGIEGLWKSRDQHSDKPRCLVAVYKYQDKYYGRMLATYDENGNIKDTIIEQKERAEGVVGHPPYCGLDFVYDVMPEQVRPGENPKYKGKIIDPKEGKVYNAELWLQGDDLVVRGEIWIFGKDIYWPPATEKDLPKGFSMKDIEKFVPVIPKVQ